MYYLELFLVGPRGWKQLLEDDVRGVDPPLHCLLHDFLLDVATNLLVTTLGTVFREGCEHVVVHAHHLVAVVEPAVHHQDDDRFFVDADRDVVLRENAFRNGKILGEGVEGSKQSEAEEDDDEQSLDEFFETHYYALLGRVKGKKIERPTIYIIN